jgi:hypothetical protein
MWQNYSIPIEEFLDWPYRKKIAYIASYLVEAENPVRLYPVILMKRGGG